MKRFRQYIIVFSFFFITSIYSQSLFNNLNGSKNISSQVIAVIDTIKITAEEFFYNYEFGPAFTKRQNNSKKVHLDFMINEKLLGLEGIKNGYLNNHEIKSIYNDIQSDIATEELYKDSILSKVEYSESELNQMIKEKSTELEIRWLFTKDKEKVFSWNRQLKNGVFFDSLFRKQITDSVYFDERSLFTTTYNLRKKNPKLAQILDTLKVGEITKPIFINDEWYIVKFDNVNKNLLFSQTEINRLTKESIEALTKIKMDSISAQYVHELLKKNSPTIKRDAFNIGRSYLGKYKLKNENYDKWSLDTKLEEALENLGLSKSSNYTEIILVELKEDNFSLEEFFTWFRNRSLYIKLPETSLVDFSKSLENLVWLMVRDKLLAEVAEEHGYYNNYWVKKQGEWWKEKIAYSAYRKDILNSIVLNNDEVAEKNNESSNQEILNHELTVKLYREISRLKKIHTVTINYDVLNKINVSNENDKQAINFYAAKNGGLIPRPPYPTIDGDWANWK